MALIQSQDTGQWQSELSPAEIAKEDAREYARKVMKLDGDDFPDISTEEAYNKLKTDPKLRRLVNRAFVREHRRPATDAEFDNVLKRALEIPFVDEPIKEKKKPFKGTTMPQGDYRDIAFGT